MYCIVIQNTNLDIDKIIYCDKMETMQIVLEKIVPEMDIAALICGYVSSLTYKDKIYSINNLTFAEDFVSANY